MREQEQARVHHERRRSKQIRIENARALDTERKLMLFIVLQTIGEGQSKDNYFLANVI